MSALLGLQQPLWSSQRGMAGCATFEVEVCSLRIPWFQLDLNSPGGAVVQQTESCSCFSQLTGRMFSSQAAAPGCAGVSSQPSLHAGEEGSVPASVFQGCSNQDSLSPKNSQDISAAEGHVLHFWESGRSAVCFWKPTESSSSPQVAAGTAGYSFLSQEPAPCLSSS